MFSNTHTSNKIISSNTLFVSVNKHTYWWNRVTKFAATKSVKANEEYTHEASLCGQNPQKSKLNSIP